MESALGTRVLPAPLTPLLGREREAAVVRAILMRPDVRLLTLTGPGGVGKTRLALRVAEDVVDSFADGVVFIPLAAVNDPALVLPTIARALRTDDGGGASIDAIQQTLADGHWLLVLDNCEHLLPAAEAWPALLSACPGVVILATSRSNLGVTGESTFGVPPMNLPRPAGDGAPGAFDELIGAEAVRLFALRAQAAQPAFVLTAENTATVAAICHRLDGLPLAIELAAARVRILHPDVLLIRLARRLPLLTGGPRDQPARLRTMTGAIDWSYGLLGSEEQRLFRNLATFAGGFTLESATAVFGAAPRAETPVLGDPMEVSASLFDSLVRLVEQSLIETRHQIDGSRGERPRFSMLETIREFGLERLADHGEVEDAARNHAEFFTRFAEEAQTVFWSSAPGASHGLWLGRLDADHDNLRLALQWALRNDAELAFRLVGALSYFWYQRGYLGEGSRWCERVLALDTPLQPAILAKALYGVSMVTLLSGNLERAAAFAEQASTHYAAIGDVSGLGRAKQVLGIVNVQTEQFEHAIPLLEAALQTAREEEHVRGMSTTLAHLGEVAARQGDFARARDHLREAVELARTHDDRFALAWSSYQMGALERAADLPAAAMVSIQESLEAYRDLGATGPIVVGLLTLGALAAATDQPVAAVRLVSAAETHWKRLAAPLLYADSVDSERILDEARSRLAPDAFAAARTAGQALSLPVAIEEALALTPASVEHGSEAMAVPGAPPDHVLTPRERDVLRLLVTGQSDADIAVTLFVSRRTVQTHVTGILTKLGAINRTEAAAIAVREGLV